MFFRYSYLLILAALAAGTAPAQETRGMIYGRVLDPPGSPIPGAAVAVENADTNTAVRLKTNDTAFPTHVDGLRGDMTNQCNVNLQRSFRIRERLGFEIRLDALNVQNRTQFAGPNVSPTSTDFGRVTSQTNTRNRFLQLQDRIRF